MKLSKVLYLSKRVKEIYAAECKEIGVNRVNNLGTLSLIIQNLPNEPLEYLVVAMAVADIPTT